MRRRSVLPLALIAAFAACGAEDANDDDATAGTVPIVSEPGETSTTPPAPTTPPSFSVEPLPPASSPPGTRPGTPIDPSMPLVTAAVDDLAGRLGIDPDAVTVVDARSVTWPDGSLGCPEPGMMYTQVLVDGTLVVLEAGGSRYEYHGGDPLFLCEHPQ
jgi:hypothetical protein